MDRKIHLHYGRIHTIDIVDVNSTMSGGATLGALIGLATGMGHSGESTIYRVIAGAILGALTEKSLTEGETAQAITLKENNARMVKVITQVPNVRAGDCVSIERHYRKVKLFRVADQYCKY